MFPETVAQNNIFRENHTAFFHRLDMSSSERPFAKKIQGSNAIFVSEIKNISKVEFV